MHCVLIQACSIATQNETNLKEYDWFVKQLKAGNLVLSYYSTSEKSL